MHNLHGMPAVLSAIFSAIYASFASVETYGTSLATIFPAMQNPNATNATEMEPLEYVIGVGSGLQVVRKYALLIPFPFTSQGYGRSGAKQGAFQLMAIGLTMVIAIVGGLITGKWSDQRSLVLHTFALPKALFSCCIALFDRSDR